MLRLKFIFNSIDCLYIHMPTKGYSTVLLLSNVVDSAVGDLEGGILLRHQRTVSTI